MCTSFTLSAPNQHFLSRTMDFSFILDAQPVFIPRVYKWQTSQGDNRETRYSFIGSGKKLENYLVADGVNEKGLAAAELYYPNFAKYSKEPLEKGINLAPHEFIMWLLGENASVQEVIETIEGVRLLDSPVALLNVTVPLHFILTDASGRTVSIETENEELTVKENPIGVMANSPNLEWHLQNLNSYVGVQANNLSTRKLGNLTLQAFGQGSGTLPLPGSFVSTDRFIRTAFIKEHLPKTSDCDETVNNIFHALDSVNVPKGIDLKDDGEIDYTQYKSALETIHPTYYLSVYESNRVYKLSLSESMATHPDPITFSVNNKMKMDHLVIE